MQVTPFLTDGVDTESHLLNPDHLEKINEGIDAESISKLIEEAADEIKDNLVAKYVNGRIDIERKAENQARINHGALAAEAPKALRSEPERFRHGKLLLKNCPRKIQRHI